MTSRKPLHPTIKRREWQIGGNGLTIPYYADEEHNKILENLLSHDKITGIFPFDTCIRGALLPFAIVCKQKSYAGLDQEGYNILGKLIVEQQLFEEAMWIGQVSLDSLTKIQSNSPNLLTSKDFHGRKIYFPTAFYVMGNK